MTMPHLTEEDLAAIDADEVAQLAGRLERDDYANPFEALKDWHVLRAVAFHNTELVEPYLYLLDIEEFDEA
ncbi:MAG: DUF2555 domain-containing protein [Spirulinaceae cyanobacterium RM2_2_10]|nr:DUF2555 domain-containing protein [Spirulinaceae cyanobacterium SM2_1_0]NJO20196.1 DUF2555 domain-containing protein [Spirulinaceae cyanobacterium RM2_2_10]